MAFHSNTHGLSETALALLDKGLREIWEDMRVAAELKANSASMSAADGDTPKVEAGAVTTRPVSVSD